MRGVLPQQEQRHSGLQLFAFAQELLMQICVSIGSDSARGVYFLSLVLVRGAACDVHKCVRGCVSVWLNLLLSLSLGSAFKMLVVNSQQFQKLVDGLTPSRLSLHGLACNPTQGLHCATRRSGQEQDAAELEAAEIQAEIEDKEQVV